MKMIEVFDLMAKKEIKHETQLIIHYDSACCSFRYHKLYQTFLNGNYERMEEEFVFGCDFLNYDVELIPPKEKKYLVKFNMRGLMNGREYLNYIKKYECVNIANKKQTLSNKTQFTEQELQSIQPVREFLEDMKGKYELIEVEDDEID